MCYNEIQLFEVADREEGKPEMNKKDNERWWQLHLRVCLGETLDAAEQGLYAEGLASMDASERSQLHTSDLAELQRLQSEVAKLEATSARLEAKSDWLNRQIWTLEGAYMVLTGFQLSSQDYATVPA